MSTLFKVGNIATDTYGDMFLIGVNVGPSNHTVMAIATSTVGFQVAVGNVALPSGMQFSGQSVGAIAAPFYATTQTVADPSAPAGLTQFGTTLDTFVAVTADTLFTADLTGQKVAASNYIGMRERGTVASVNAIMNGIEITA